MEKYRKKPVVIEAVQLTFENQAEVKEWCGGETYSTPPMRAVTGIEIKTLMMPDTMLAGTEEILSTATTNGSAQKKAWRSGNVVINPVYQRRKLNAIQKINI